MKRVAEHDKISLKVIIFDLDGTLYKSPEIYQKFAEAAYYTYAKLRKTTIEQAKSILETRREEIKRQRGYPVPYTLALLSLDIPIEAWHKENIKFFDPGKYLQPDIQLKRILKELKIVYQLAVLTNNNRIQTDRILRALGIKDLFSHIFTYETFKLIKPNLEIFRQVIQKLNLRPEECMMVGDRYDVDLVPAKEIGMQIFEVKGPEDISKLPPLTKWKMEVEDGVLLNNDSGDDE
ncbi:MAG: HAD family hydrolase [bacterium]